MIHLHCIWHHHQQLNNNIIAALRLGSIGLTQIPIRVHRRGPTVGTILLLLLPVLPLAITQYVKQAVSHVIAISHTDVVAAVVPPPLFISRFSLHRTNSTLFIIPKDSSYNAILSKDEDEHPSPFLTLSDWIWVNVASVHL